MPTLHLLGDSICLGYKEELANLLGKDYSMSSNNEEENTFDSARLLSCIYDLEDAEYKIDVLLVNSGINDIKTYRENEKKQVRLKLYGRNIESVVEEGLNFANKLFWISTTPVNIETHKTNISDFDRYNEDVVVYNNLAAQIMADNKIPIIDLYTLVEELNEDKYSDHIHFNDKVTKLQAKFIRKFIP